MTETIKQRVAQVAFWDGWVCLACGHTVETREEHSRGDPCPECDQDSMTEAKAVDRFLRRVEEDERSGDTGFTSLD